jgi:hypothetical protein
MPVTSPWRLTSGCEQALIAMMTTETQDSQRGLTLWQERKTCCGAANIIVLRQEFTDQVLFFGRKIKEMACFHGLTLGPNTTIYPPSAATAQRLYGRHRRILFEPPFPPVCVEDGNQPLLRACLGAFSRFLRTICD